MQDEPRSGGWHVTNQAASVEAFEAHRPLLVSVAYRMLGSLAEAEDVVQEAWLRWDRTDQDDIEDARAFLVRVTTRLAIDRLRSLKARRESYLGPWLPEPILTEANVGEATELAESVSLALLVVLETLSPLERAVFVLREAFDYSYAEIGEIIGRQESTVRQLARRARDHVQQRQPRFDADQATRRRVTEQFLAACNNGNVDALMAILAPGVTLYADSGGRVRAPRRPIVGADKVARFFLSVWKIPYREWVGVTEGPDLELQVVQVNDGPAILGTAGEQPIGVLTLDVADGVIQAIRFVANPDKLSGLSREATA
jgi:RNA polymerase sigma-70 factor (TIGR02957 family)